MVKKNVGKWFEASHERTLYEKIQQLLEIRKAQYGDPYAAFSNIAKRWSHVLGISVTPQQTILCMIELKKARLDYNPQHEDSKLDILGYQLCLQEINQKGEAERGRKGRLKRPFFLAFIV
jgi:translation initiation factor 2 alpha subunit (eIF-2alpha)